MSREPDPRDPFAQDDAAYLLGALSTQDSARYEQHLQTCAACRRSLDELAALPGLLGRVSLDAVRAVDGETADASAGVDDRSPWEDPSAVPPPSVLAGALERARLEERRARRVRAVRWASALTTAAAAVVVGVLALVGPGPGEPVPASSPPAVELALEPVADTRLRAVVTLRDVAWGTRIQVECEYPQTGPADPYAAAPQYSLVVHDADGDVEQVATWNAVAGRTLTIDAASAVRGDAIVAVEIREQDGTPVLRSAG